MTVTIMKSQVDARALLDHWSANPIPNLSLSASGLVVLADLHTIAQRTTVTGGSSWLDALVLAPGLHYQQAADALDRDSGPSLFAQLAKAAQGIPDGKGVEAAGVDLDRFSIDNVATASYLRRLFRNNNSNEITLDIGSVGSPRPAFAQRLTRSLSSLVSGKQQHSVLQGMVDGTDGKIPPGANDQVDIDWLSHLLYLSTPILTTIAVIFDVLLEEWWGLAFIGALMISRLLNIWAIKQRTKPIMMTHGDEDESNDHDAEYTVDLGSGRRVILRGQNRDLQAVTTQAWLRGKTHVEGYLEALAKLIVYVVAALGGNMSQVGALILIVLLFSSAGLLGLSNAHATAFEMHGRVARRHVPKDADGRRKTSSMPLPTTQPRPQAMGSSNDMAGAHRPSIRRISRETRRDRYSHSMGPMEHADTQ